MIEINLEHLLKVQRARLALYQCHIVDGEIIFELRHLEQLF